MGLVRRTAAVVVPLGLVIGGVAYGVSRHSSGSDNTLGLCTAEVGHLTVQLSDVQARNASLVAAIAVRRGMPAHAATIALAAALQESKLYNLRGGDRDSLGLFQQRPSQGWGTPAQILDPVHATNAFYDALDKVDRYDTLPVTVAAQRVQRSGYPSAYAAYEATRGRSRRRSPATPPPPSGATCASRSRPRCPRLPSGHECCNAPWSRRSAGSASRSAPAAGSGSRPRAARAAGRWRPTWSPAPPSSGSTACRYAGRTWSTGSDAGWRADPKSVAGAVVLH